VPEFFFSPAAVLGDWQERLSAYRDFLYGREKASGQPSPAPSLSPLLPNTTTLAEIGHPSQSVTLAAFAEQLRLHESKGASIRTMQATSAVYVKDTNMQLAVAKSLAGLLLGESAAGNAVIGDLNFVLPLILLTEEFDNRKYRGDWVAWANTMAAQWVPERYSALNTLWRPVIFLVHSKDSERGQSLNWLDIFNTCTKQEKEAQIIRKLVLLTDDQDLIDKYKWQSKYVLKDPGKNALQRAKSIGSRPGLEREREQAEEYRALRPAQLSGLIGKGTRQVKTHFLNHG